MVHRVSGLKNLLQKKGISMIWKLFTISTIKKFRTRGNFSFGKTQLYKLNEDFSKCAKTVENPGCVCWQILPLFHLIFIDTLYPLQLPGWQVPLPGAMTVPEKTPQKLTLFAPAEPAAAVRGRLGATWGIFFTYCSRKSAGVIGLSCMVLRAQSDPRGRGVNRGRGWRKSIKLIHMYWGERDGRWIKAVWVYICPW